MHPIKAIFKRKGIQMEHGANRQKNSKKSIQSYLQLICGVQQINRQTYEWSIIHQIMEQVV